MSESEIRMGVIGAGRMGGFHASKIEALEGCRLTVVADRSKQRAEALAAKYPGAKGYKRYPKAFGQVDAVIVAVPTSLHYEVVRDFLNEGVHCLVEKPIATTVEEAEELIQLADSKGLVLQVGHIERFNAGVRYLRGILDRPAFIECHRLGPFTSRVSDVGVVLDLMIHDIDIVLQIVQSPLVEMDAVGVPILTDKEDIANVRLKFENGCRANMTVSRVSPKPTRKIRVFQQDAYVSIDYAKQALQLYQRVPREQAGPGEPQAEIVRKRVRLKKEDLLTLEVQDFAQAVRDAAKPQVTGEHGRDALHLAVEIARRISEQNPMAELDRSAPTAGE